MGRQEGVESEIVDDTPASCFFGEQCECREPEDVGSDLESEMSPVIISLWKEKGSSEDLKPLLVNTLRENIERMDTHISKEEQGPCEDKEAHA
jgi:hypothetical protein